MSLISFLPLKYLVMLILNFPATVFQFFHFSYLNMFQVIVIYFNLLERQSEKKANTEAEIFHPLVHSLNVHNGQCWAQPCIRARNHIWVFVMGSRCQARVSSWMERREVQSKTSIAMKNTDAPRGSLTFLATTPECNN